MVGQPGPLVLILVGSLVLAGCSRSTSGPESEVPSGSDRQSSPGPPLSFAWADGSDPTVTRAEAGLDERYINPGAVIERGGVIHMFANLFTAWPGRVRVQHLVSSDGVSWTLDSSESVFDSEEVPFTEGGADVSTGFVADDGTWVLIFETVSADDPWVLGRATAPAPEGPWTIDPVPILAGGGEGSWDGGGLAWPSVVPTAEGYAMYYTAFDRPGGTGVIGLAESPDGANWTKRGTPVLVAEQGWEQGSLDRPRVAITPGGMVMVYAGADLTDRGIAWSRDGVVWNRAGDQPAITQADFPVDGRAWDAALLYRSGELIYYLEIGTIGPEGTEVYRAVAELPAVVP